MRRFALWCVVLLGGCGGPSAPFFLREYSLGRTQEAQVGDVMMAWTIGQGSTIYGGGIRRELSYNGIAQGILQIAYREYTVNPSGTFIREAFSRELRYDLTVSKIIGYQDVRISITAANSEKIVYIVLNEPFEISGRKSPGAIEREFVTPIDRSYYSSLTGKGFIEYPSPRRVSLLYTNGVTAETYLISEDDIAYFAVSSFRTKEIQRIYKSIVKEVKLK